MRPLYALFSILLLNGVSVAAQIPTDTFTAKVLSESAQVEFNAVGRPSALKIKGKGSTLDGALIAKKGQVSGEVSFDLNTLDTGIKLRNEHMKEKYLETKKYGKTTLKLQEFRLPEALSKEDGYSKNVSFQGLLILHGVEKQVSGTADLKRAGDKISVSTSFDIKLSDFGIATPSFAGITVAEDVQVAVQFESAIGDSTKN